MHNDSEFIQLVIDKYNNAKKQSQLEILNFDPAEMKRTGELTVFEYAFGLGKELTKKCPELFPQSKAKNDDSKIEGISFLILTELFNLDYLSMGKLATELVKYKDVIDFKELKDEIVKACIDIRDRLKDYIKAPTVKKGSLACHSEIQLASYILAILRLRFEISITDGLKRIGGNNRKISDLIKYLPNHYLYDILRDYWSGAGNVKLEEEIKKEPSQSRYIKNVDAERFEHVLTDWLQQGNERLSNSVSTESRLFWNYYLRSVAPNEIASGKFDIEHCAPQETMKTYYTQRGFRVAVHSPCNLTYIPLGDNRAKQNLTYYQKQDQGQTAFRLSEDQLDKYLYPRRSELRFVESVDSMTVENYNQFLKNRLNTICHRVIPALFG